MKLTYLFLLVTLVSLGCFGQDAKQYAENFPGKFPCETRDGKLATVSADALGKCLYNGATFDEWDRWHEDIAKALENCKRPEVEEVAITDAIFQHREVFSCKMIQKIFGTGGVTQGPPLTTNLQGFAKKEVPEDVLAIQEKLPAIYPMCRHFHFVEGDLMQCDDPPDPPNYKWTCADTRRILQESVGGTHWCHMPKTQKGN